RTMYRGFISATLLIIGVSVLIGFLLANTIYVNFTKEDMTRENAAIAEQIVRDLESFHLSADVIHPYLNSVAGLGYQIYLTNDAGEDEVFGEPIDHSRL